jgi:hypothetical protein
VFGLRGFEHSDAQTAHSLNFRKTIRERFPSGFQELIRALTKKLPKVCT